jgi:hypothetical protein
MYVHVHVHVHVHIFFGKTNLTNISTMYIIYVHEDVHVHTFFGKTNLTNTWSQFYDRELQRQRCKNRLRVGYIVRFGNKKWL